MDDSPASYVHLVHQLIEHCLIFNMTKEECMEALSKHANIIPVITSTVWTELEKENKEFFRGYWETLEEKKKKALDSGSDTSKRIEQILSDSSEGNSDQQDRRPDKQRC